MAGTRTALFGRQLPGGIFTIEDQEFTTGSHFFVDSTTGTDGSTYGASPEAPFATIDYAIGKCTADKGDIIHVMPKHAENLSSATACVCDIAGVTIRGVSRNPYLMPRLTIDTGTASLISVTAAGVTLENLWIEMNFADIVAAVSVAATDCVIRNCYFMESTTNMNAKIAITTGATTTASRLVVENCYAKMLDAANTNFVAIAGTPDGVIIRNNTLIGDWGTYALGAAGVVTNITIANNYVYNAASDNDSCINVANTGTGIVMGNLCCGAAAQANGVTATTCAICQNYYGVISEDLSGILEPIAT